MNENEERKKQLEMEQHLNYEYPALEKEELTLAIREVNEILDKLLDLTKETEGKLK